MGEPLNGVNDPSPLPFKNDHRIVVVTGDSQVSVAVIVKISHYNGAIRLYGDDLARRGSTNSSR